ncbi:nucleotidyltransferase domain-containing protein [Gordonia sp. CPCC 205515]|uniref:nucleotidyltransferase family protein n=1 Tax=Gordonia sp. CPCC 205515 TaxID=3140791 RepID=UPI003AF34F00
MSYRDTISTDLALPVPLAELVAILRCHNVTEAYVFGSYARGEQTADSDLDLLVAFAEPRARDFFDLHTELEERIPCHVDLTTALHSAFEPYIRPDLVPIV